MMKFHILTPVMKLYISFHINNGNSDAKCKLEERSVEKGLNSEICDFCNLPRFFGLRQLSPVLSASVFLSCICQVTNVQRLCVSKFVSEG